MGIDNIRHPIKDTVKADNSTYSSNKIESLIHSATELPETGVEDAGDVLMVNEEGEWAKGEIIIPQEVPTPTAADIGKIVSVVSDGDEGAEYGLEDIPSEVPVPAVADSGKVISVNASGEYELTTPVSGASFIDFRIVGDPDHADQMKFYDGTKTIQDVIDAIDAGNIVRLYYATSALYLTLTQYSKHIDPVPSESYVNMTFSATRATTWTTPIALKTMCVYVETEPFTGNTFKFVNL